MTGIELTIDSSVVLKVRIKEHMIDKSKPEIFIDYIYISFSDHGSLKKWKTRFINK